MELKYEIKDNKKRYGILPYNYKKIKTKYLVTTRFGTWCLLDEHEFLQLSRMEIQDELRKELTTQGIIINENNATQIIKNFKRLNANLFQGPSLHIISMTSKCNYDCVYCHAGSPTYTKDKSHKSLDKDGAIKIMDFIFKANSNAITVEFQGGEPTMNFEVLSFMVKELRRFNKIEKKDLKICIVTNLSTMTEERLDFFKEYGVTICTSLDGPRELHNKNRPYVGGKGSYEIVTKWIKIISDKYGNNSIGALPTITRYLLPYPKEIVDEYISHGFTQVHLRFLNYLGEAKKNWGEIGYDADEFIKFWTTAMDYIIELNKKGIRFKERMATIMLTKILKKKDPMYTELMSPCGAGRTQILYNEDGNIYTCDEGRMLGEDVFKMGNFYKDAYEKVMTSDALMYACESSLIDNYSPNNVFLPWTGTCPVVNMSKNSNIIAKLPMCMVSKIYDAQFEYLFAKMIDDTEAEKIFWSWVE